MSETRYYVVRASYRSRQVLQIRSCVFDQIILLVVGTHLNSSQQTTRCFSGWFVYPLCPVRSPLCILLLDSSYEMKEINTTDKLDSVLETKTTLLLVFKLREASYASLQFRFSFLPL